MDILNDLRNLYYECFDGRENINWNDFIVFVGNDVFSKYQDMLIFRCNVLGEETPDSLKFKGWTLRRDGNLKPNEIVVYKVIKKVEL